MLTDGEIIVLARKYLDIGLSFGNGHITRSTDSEIVAFAKSLISAESDAVVSMRALLSKIAYPRRGTDDESMDIFQAAELIQAAFTREQLIDG